MYSFNVGNFDEWRAVARALLRANIAPSEVSWQPLEQHGLFAVSLISDVIAQAHPASSNEVLKIPHDFLTRAKQAACFIDNKEPAKKWSVLYSLLWRIKNDGKKTLLLKSVRLPENIIFSTSSMPANPSVRCHWTCKKLAAACLPEQEENICAAREAPASST